jgi:hypothetical protein
VIADTSGRAISFRIAPGQAYGLPHAIPLLEQLPGVPTWVVGDRGYTSHSLREHICSIGARPAIPPQRHEAPVACPEWIYNNRNVVERFWASRCYTLREDRLIFHVHSLPRRYTRLD